MMRFSLPMLFVLCGLNALTGYSQQVVFKDELNKIDVSEWEIALPSGDSAVVMQGGSPRLHNRAYLFPRVEIDGPATYEFDWAYIELIPLIEASKDLEDAKKLRLAKLRRPTADNFMVTLHTDLKLKEGRSWEPMNGLKIVLNAGYGQISVDKVVDGKNTKLPVETFIRTTDKAIEVIAASEDKIEPAIAHQVWYRVRIQDTGKLVRVYLKHVDAPDADFVLCLESPYSGEGLKGNRVSFGNREINSGVPTTSKIRNVRITK